MTVERAIELQERSWNFQAEGMLDEASCACREALRLFELEEDSHSPDVANLLNDLADIEHRRRCRDNAFQWSAFDLYQSAVFFLKCMQVPRALQNEP